MMVLSFHKSSHPSFTAAKFCKFWFVEALTNTAT